MPQSSWMSQVHCNVVHSRSRPSCINTITNDSWQRSAPEENRSMKQFCLMDQMLLWAATWAVVVGCCILADPDARQAASQAAGYSRRSINRRRLPPNCETFTCMPLKKMVVTCVPLKKLVAPVCHRPKLLCPLCHFVHDPLQIHR
jgi:hypothetical protein